MSTIQAEFAQIIALHGRGELAAAETACRELLARSGPLAQAEHMLALTLHAQGRSDEAIVWFERAAQASTGAAFWSNYAAALLAVGRLTEAADFSRRAIGSDSRYLGAWLNLGLASELQRNLGEAISAFENALKIVPGQPVAVRALARCRIRTGEPAVALAVLAALPADTDASADLLRCEAWIGTGDLASASAQLTRLAEKKQSRKEALLLQAKIATEQGHSNKALDMLGEVLQIDPANRQAIVRSALMRINRAEMETGLSQLRDWLDQHPEDQSAASSYLIACDYSERFDAAELLAEHRRRRPLPTPAESWPQGWSARPGGKLRIGWVSSAFSVGPMEIFFADVLKAFADVAPDIEHVLYAVGGESTAAPASASWARNQRDASRLGDRELLAMIRADGNDILVDTIGRAAGNRLAVFAARAAPVQVGWLDVFYPSGVDAMDYLVTDARLNPPGDEAYFAEKLLRLPHGRLAYSPPPAQAPRLEGVASKRFVSLNRFGKLNDSVIAVWSAILKELPDWSLLLKARGGDDADLAAVFLARFEAQGIASDRIQIVGAGPYAAAMETYQIAAIALDPFPFSGCSTSCDALWMGLPVVTWPRDTIASRQTAAMLDAARLSDWIASDAEAYVAKAVGLARDEEARRRWRINSREHIRPVLCDSHRLAQELLDALRSIALPRL